LEGRCQNAPNGVVIRNLGRAYQHWFLKKYCEDIARSAAFAICNLDSDGELKHAGRFFHLEFARMFPSSHGFGAIGLAKKGAGIAGRVVGFVADGKAAS
jgi:hypothetical protein